tara:strand:+ start:241 stop:1443 length:1203 start_codon:yes stop_codon:yes gene_type:complete
MKKIIPAVIGLGYVGLPIFLQVNKKFQSVGFDINAKRIKDLIDCHDTNNEFVSKELKIRNKSKFTRKINDLKKSNFFIVTVPTPVLNNKKPDLRPLKSACEILKKVIKDDDIVFFESTVYPGVTRYLRNKYFKKKRIWIGYSPERINPGDKKNTIKTIKKIVSFDPCPKKIKSNILNVYRTITKNIILSNSIENAEMSKVIENIQRDINIAFMNEILMVSKKLNLNFKEVIKLAKTKWNFLNFSPGLVGGHCLPVDPFYLYHLAKRKNYNAKFMLAGRSVNDEVSKFIKDEIKKKIRKIKANKILILGLSYKANVADSRNSLAIKIYLDLKKIYKKNLFGYDPIIDQKNQNKYKLIKSLANIDTYDLIIPLVNHKIFVQKFYNNFVKNKKRYYDPFNYFN